MSDNQPKPALPERDQTSPAGRLGLFRKFDVRRTDGSSEPGGKHEHCEYFVLDVDHDPCAKAALTAYANAVESTHPVLAADMRDRYGLDVGTEPATQLTAGMLQALRFYARGEHYLTDDDEEFDTVSGEPDNWLCSGLENSSTMIEDGGIARRALLGQTLNWVDGGEDQTPQPIEGEPLHRAQALTFAEFRAANRTRCLRWHPAGIESWSDSDWITAIVGELGELAGLIKMRNRERDGLPGNKFSPTNEQIAKEAADVYTYLDLFCERNGIDLGLSAALKFNEVSERVGFPDRIELRAETA